MKTSKTAHDRFLATPSRRRLYEQERLLVEATEVLSEMMEKKGISRAQLAHKLGKSKAYVTQILRGNQNLTLRTLANLFDVLDVRISLKAGLREQHEPATSASAVVTHPNCYEFEQYKPFRGQGADAAIRFDDLPAGGHPPQFGTGYSLSMRA